MLVIWFGYFVCYCSVGFSKYMRHRDQANLHLFDPEPERTLHRLLREQRTEQTRDRTTMENNEDQNLDVERNEPQRGKMGITAGIKHPGRLYSQMILSCF